MTRFENVPPMGCKGSILLESCTRESSARLNSPTYRVKERFVRQCRGADRATHFEQPVLIAAVHGENVLTALKRRVNLL